MGITMSTVLFNEVFYLEGLEKEDRRGLVRGSC